MTRTLPALAAAVALSLGVLSAPQAIAKGGQDAYERQQELQAQFEKARQHKRQDNSTNFFEALFGSDTDAAKTKSKDKAAAPKTE